MSSLEYEVVSVLETLIHSTVNEMSTILTQTTADESVSMEFTDQLNSVLEHNAKEAVKKICQIFSALLHHDISPSAQETRPKQVEQWQKAHLEVTDLPDIDLYRSYSTDQLSSLLIKLLLL